MDAQRQQHITLLSLKLMEDHGLVRAGWYFRFDNAKKRLGLCSFRNRTISISRYFASVATDEQVEQIMLHEIAHALLPSGVGHGPRWKALAREIGYTGERTLHNPYIAQQNAQRLAAAQATTDGTFEPEIPGPIGVGDTVRFNNLRTGTVKKVGRTRFHILMDDDNRIWFNHFRNVTRIAAANTAESQEHTLAA